MKTTESVNSSHNEPLRCWKGDPAAATVMETACLGTWKARCFLFVEDQLKTSLVSHKFVPSRIADGSWDSFTSEIWLASFGKDFFFFYSSVLCFQSCMYR